MVFPRLIPVLLVHRGGLEKSERFKTWKYVGDVLNAIKIFNEKDVDEITVLDVDAARDGRPPDFDMIAQLAGECFMPLSYGGGIRSLEDARRAMGLGVEKIVLNTEAWRRPELVGEIAGVLGSSSTVVSVDVIGKRRSLVRYDHLTGKPVKGDVAQALRRFVDLGAGELLIQAKDRDGTLAGPDLELMRATAEGLDVPVVYAGGISSLDDVVAAWSAGASGVAAGAWFVFRGPHRAVIITYPKYADIKAAHARVQ